MYKEIGELRSEGYALTKDRVPDAPFDKNWHELAMKRMLRYAAENGYDVVAWTKGEQQAERYNIGGVLEAIQHYESEKGRVVIVKPRNNESSRFVVNNEGLIIESRGPLSGDATTLSEVVGKELASKIMSGEGEDIEKRDGATYYPAKMIKGEGIRIGGEGMKGFYDRMLPAFMNKYGKKWGVKVEDIHLNLEGGLDMHSVPVTDEMKESVMEGQTMFKTRRNPLDTTNESTTFAAITPEVRREMDIISATAIVNGNYMKAPNGKDSKLTPEQWAMVRTKNFLNWAGDWINDPENAAVVLDVETREPLVLYHGTPRAGFTEFKSGWFTTSKEDAISYSGDRKGRMFDPNEKYEPETLTAGDFRLGYMTFDSEEDRAAFLAEHPTAESAMSESEYENARIQAEDEEYDTLTERKPELQKIWDAYREYERDHFVDTTIGEILNNPDAYTEDDLRRAVLAYDSNAVFDSIDELETTEERKSALLESLTYMNGDAKV